MLAVFGRRKLAQQVSDTRYTFFVSILRPPEHLGLYVCRKIQSLRFRNSLILAGSLDFWTRNIAARTIFLTPIVPLVLSACLKGVSQDLRKDIKKYQTADDTLRASWASTPSSSSSQIGIGPGKRVDQVSEQGSVPHGLNAVSLAGTDVYYRDTLVH